MRDHQNDNDQIQKMIYGISHDMGAPLRAVVQFSKLLQSRLDDQLDDKTRYWLELIHDGGEQAQKMVDSLLVYSRLSTQREENQTFSLKFLIDELIDHFRELESDNQVQFSLKGEFIDVTGCYSQYSNLFQQLLSNALLFHSEDCNQQKIINLSAITKDDTLIVSIEDNGIGIKESNIELITTPFKKLNGESYPGLGMGLAYCERICQLNGATLSFNESSLNGLRVTCSIPLEST